MMFHELRGIDHSPNDSSEECFSFPKFMASSSEGEGSKDIKYAFFCKTSSASFPPPHPDSTPDFEFDMSVVEPEVGESIVSPADELFFKGQLLPLHLPPRLQMVQNLTCIDEEEAIEVANEEDKSDSFSFKMACDLKHKDSECSFCSPDRFPPDLLWQDSPSSSFGSQLSSFWDSGDKDSLDSSCRDSNGSSQDSYISSKDLSQEAMEESIHANAVDNSYSQKHKCQSSSWLRTPFRWKSLLRSKKASQIKLSSKSNQKSSNADKSKPCSRSRSRDSISFRPSSPFLISPFFMGEKSVRQGRKNCVQHGLTSASGLWRNQTMCINNSKLDRNHVDGKAAGDVWHRYLKLLKPTTSSPCVESRGSEKRDAWQSYEQQLRMDVYNAATAKHAADGTAEKTPSCSFLSGNLRISSFSRRSSTPTSRVNSSRSSPSHSGVLVTRCSPNDTVLELHSAIQGAIAHCKQSQSQSQMIGRRPDPSHLSK